MKILNKRGERGHICFRLQVTEKQSVLKLLILTEHLTPLYKDLIARHIFVSIPKEVSFFYNKVPSIVSYACLKLILCRFTYLFTNINYLSERCYLIYCISSLTKTILFISQTIIIIYPLTQSSV